MGSVELEEKRREAMAKEKSRRTVLCLFMGFVGIIMMIVGYIQGHNSGDPNSGLFMISAVGMLLMLATASIMMMHHLRNK